jgi:hypothetical protein
MYRHAQHKTNREIKEKRHSVHVSGGPYATTKAKVEGAGERIKEFRTQKWREEIRRLTRSSMTTVSNCVDNW